ncbi:hypothetical protein OXX59_005483 [Metschnikowia pulcherrima]
MSSPDKGAIRERSSQQQYTEQHEHSILIPHSSFTALKLLHSTPSEISHLSTSVFLGKVPDAWIKLSDKSSIFAMKKPSRHSTRTWVTTTASGFRRRLNKASGPGVSGTQNITSIDPCDVPADIWEESSAESGSTSKDLREEIAITADTDFGSLDSDDFDEMLYGKISERGEGTTQQVGGSNDKMTGKVESRGNDVTQASMPKFLLTPCPSNDSEVGKAHETFGDSYDQEQHSNSLSADAAFSSNKTSHNNGGELHKDASSDVKFTFQISKSEPSRPQKSNQYTLHPLENNQFLGDADISSKFKRAGIGGSKVQFANPEPEERRASHLLQKEYVHAEREHNRAIRKMQTLAHKSRGKARASTSKLKLKIVDSLLQKREKGETIRVDRMLVMIKKAQNISSISAFFDRGELNASIEDHWREYHVVLKTTDNKACPLRACLFETGRRNDFSGKPDHEFDLSKDMKADFVSLVDKTISVAREIDDGLVIYIMNTRYTMVAHKWLYMIKEISNVEFFSTVSVTLANEGKQIRANIPANLVERSLVNAETVKLLQLPTGYSLENDTLLSFLKSKIDSHTRGGKANDWANRNPNPAFCFRFYDRVEWALGGKSLVLQSQLYREKSCLEYRQLPSIPLYLRDSEGKAVPRPFSIEGFLARVTSTSGKEISKLRAFYKIQYFCTSESILFFSSIFRGIPPSPQNKLLEKNVEKESICNSLPAVYVKNSYEVDENDHFAGLRDTAFDGFENEASKEYSRKLQQIVGAKGMVDLCMISTVRPVPADSFQSRHLYFQSYLWYSSATTIEDATITDSGFEIELINGSRIKLLAPSRATRDEWVARLNDLATFWKLYRARSTEAQANSKVSNMEHLRLEDFVDSNLSFGPDSLEVKNSVANDSAFNILGLSMSTCVLCSGYLYQKQKKHSNFSRYYVVLCPGYLLIFSLFRRSKVTGVWKATPYFERYMTIPISDCYVYSESSTQSDLVASQNIKNPGECDLPRLHPDGWKSSEEDYMRCFSIWFGGKRALRHGARDSGLDPIQGAVAIKNPGMVHMARKSGVTGKVFVFLARSRQEREFWVHNLLQELNRFSKD